MGYVPPTKNETAVFYGNRVVDQKPSVTKVKPIQPAAFSFVQRQDEKNAYKLEEGMEIMRKRHEIEKKYYGKGRQFDALG